MVVVDVLWSCLYFVGFGIFFFKQKTAYEMRISDWSSDVCSSDISADRHSRPRGRELFPHRLAFAPAPLGKGSRDGRASFWQMGVSLLAHLFSRYEFRPAIFRRCHPACLARHLRHSANLCRHDHASVPADG